MKTDNKSHTPNTAIIDPKFISPGHWVPGDYRERGFEMVDVTITGCGPLYGQNAINTKMPRVLEFKDENGIKHRIDYFEGQLCQAKINAMHFDEFGYNAAIRNLKKMYPYHTFKVESVVVRNVETGQYIKLCAKSVRDRGTKLVAVSLDGVPHKRLKANEMMFALGDLFYDGCRYEPGSASSGFVCGFNNPNYGYDSIES